MFQQLYFYFLILFSIPQSNDSQQKSLLQQDKYIAINFTGPIKSFFNQIFQGNKFLNIPKQLAENFELKKVAASVSESYYGVLLQVIVSMKLSAGISSKLQNIFQLNSIPQLQFEGNIFFDGNFFTNPAFPSFYMLRVTLAQSSKIVNLKNNDPANITFSFQKISLELRLSKNESDNNYSIDWGASIAFTIANLSSSIMTLQGSYDSSDNCLRAQFNQPIHQLFKIRHLDSNYLKLAINFTDFSINVAFQITIQQRIIIYFEGIYSNEEISLTASISQLTMTDILAVINYFAGSSLSLSYLINFKYLFLRIKWNKQRKLQLEFQCQINVGQTQIFEGSLSYKDSSLALTGTIPQISFKILDQQISLKDTTIRLGYNKEGEYLSYSGKFNYVTTGGKSLTISNTNVQIKSRKGQKYYKLEAEFQISQEPFCDILNLIGVRSISVCHKSAKFDGQRSLGGMSLIAKFAKFRLGKYTIDLTGSIDIAKRQINGTCMIQNTNSSNEDFLRLNSVFIACSLAPGSTQISLGANISSPKYHNLTFVATIMFGQRGLGFEIKMFGIISLLNDRVKIGYQNTGSSGEYSQISFSTTGTTVSLGIKSQIQLYDIIGYCEARVENNLPTYFAIGLKNLKISKVINAICNFFNNVRNQSTKTISLSDNAIILKEGSFSYDLYSFEMNSYFDLIFFKNELIIECHYSPVSMIYKGSFERPVKIGPLILSSATNSKQKGASVDIEISATNPHVHIDCRVQIGPFSADAIVNISKQQFDFKIQVHLFIFSLLIEANLDYQRLSGSFTLMKRKQQSDLSKFLEEMFNKASLKKQNKQKTNIQLSFMERKVILDNYFSDKKSAAIETNKSRSNNIKEVFQNTEIIARIQQQILQTATIKQKYKKDSEKYARQKQTIHAYEVFIEERQKLNNLPKNKAGDEKSNEISNAQKEVGDIIQKINLQYKNTIGSQEKQKKVLLQHFNKYNLPSSPKLRLKGFFNDLIDYGRDAIHYIRDRTGEALGKLAPSIDEFIFTGKVAFRQKWQYFFMISIKFTFLGKQKKIKFEWGDHFQTELIQSKIYSDFINIAVEYVRTVYVIPQSIFLRYNLISEAYQDILNGKLQGLNAKINQNFDNIQFSLGTPSIFQIYSKTQNPQFLCFQQTVSGKTQQFYVTTTGKWISRRHPVVELKDVQDLQVDQIPIRIPTYFSPSNIQDFDKSKKGGKLFFREEQVDLALKNAQGVKFVQSCKQVLGMKVSPENEVFFQIQNKQQVQNEVVYKKYIKDNQYMSIYHQNKVLFSPQITYWKELTVVPPLQITL